MKNKAFIIAEVGTMHGGSVEVAKYLIKEIKDTGADAVKLQMWTKPFVKKTDELWQFFEDHQLSLEDFKTLYEYGKEIGIEVFASVFDKESADYLEGLGVKRWKIASRTLKDDKRLFVYILGKEGIKYISTGMSDIPDIDLALGTGDDDVIMHCVSKYPVPDKEANLSRINDLMLKLGTTKIGYSDHTVGIDACIHARAMGAIVIEKHIRADHSSKDHPDYSCSIPPELFKIMVAKIRRLEKMY